VNNPRIRDLAARIEVRPIQAWSHEPERVVVRLRDGRTLTAEKSRPKAPAKEDFIAKFRNCAGRHLAGSDVDELYDRIMDIEKLPTVGALTAAFAKPATR
jgi:hypothetical protein